MASPIQGTPVTVCIGASLASISCPGTNMYQPPAVSECRCLATTISLSQACSWDPKMRAMLVTRTRSRSLRKTLEAPNLGPQFWDQESKCFAARASTARTLLCHALKFLRLTFRFVFWKLLARVPTHTVYKIVLVLLAGEFPTLYILAWWKHT